MSSFFTKGFAGMMTNSKGKKEKKKEKTSSKKDTGRWNMVTDTYGQQYWQHSVTGDTTSVYGGGLVSPVGTVNPSPVVYPGGATVFTPSPVFPVAPAKAKKKQEKGKGWWETMYDDDGDRYWKHTVTKKKTYKDPYF